MGVILRGTPICDVDPLGGGATDISGAARRRSLYDLTIRLQFLLPLKEDAKNHETKDMRIVNVLQNKSENTTGSKTN